MEIIISIPQEEEMFPNVVKMAKDMTTAVGTAIMGPHVMVKARIPSDLSRVASLMVSTW